MAAAHRHFRRKSSLPNTLATLNLFVDSMDFSESLSDGWRILLTLCDQAASIGGNKRDRIEILSWQLRQSSPDIKEHFDKTQCSNLLNYLFYGELQETASILLGIDRKEELMNTALAPQGYTILHRRVAFAEVDLYPYLAKSPRLHIMGRDTNLSPSWETPTSLSMYSSWAFKLWLDALRMLAIEFHDFIIQELEQGPLREFGWNNETLLVLFHLPIRSIIPPRDPGYGRCAICFRDLHVRVQPSWLQRLERIKESVDLDIKPSTPGEVSSDRGGNSVFDNSNVCTKNDGNKEEDEEKTAQMLASGVNEAKSLEGVVDETHSTNSHDEKASYNKTDVLCVWCWKECKNE